MVDDGDERHVIVQAQSQLEDWTARARMEAYSELFEGEDPLLSAEDLRLLDALDSRLERQGDDGIWGTDQYGIHSAGETGPDLPLGVVCVYRPQVTADSVLRGGAGLDDDTEERINTALWDYSERVSALIEEELAAFLRETQQ
ncbi:hypothetical protein ACFQH2_06975 [Natronoarchaeum sp. GCM10025703]|uniref:DUF7539 family protein n=1 Tax=unclassified Natronoarchaeum TaxID=2620183 RepID=UPI00360FDBA5